MAPPRRYENTERRQAALKEKGIFHIGMGVSGGEEGARNGAPPTEHCCIPPISLLALILPVLTVGLVPAFPPPLICALGAPSAAGPAMMPGGDAEAYAFLQPIVEKVAAQTNDGACVTYIGKGGSGACWLLLWSARSVCLFSCSLYCTPLSQRLTFAGYIAVPPYPPPQATM